MLTDMGTSVDKTRREKILSFCLPEMATEQRGEDKPPAIKLLPNCGKMNRVEMSSGLNSGAGGHHAWCPQSIVSRGRGDAPVVGNTPSRCDSGFNTIRSRGDGSGLGFAVILPTQTLQGAALFHRSAVACSIGAPPLIDNSDPDEGQVGRNSFLLLFALEGPYVDADAEAWESGTCLEVTSDAGVRLMYDIDFQPMLGTDDITEDAMVAAVGSWGRRGVEIQEGRTAAPGGVKVLAKVMTFGASLRVAMKQLPAPKRQRGGEMNRALRKMIEAAGAAKRLLVLLPERGRWMQNDKVNASEEEILQRDITYHIL
ncbi:unnamed protein product [Sphagnum jensenii]|uniref:Uncharacterized protein n=1 Tax=Sphagnum jensenii TaxID=128206 RepID=A0ABP1C272_9BRYO